MNRVCSIFSQILQLFPRRDFEKAVQQHRAERHARGFTCWGQFVAMLFCQLGRAQSLREICYGLAACEGKLRHLGVPQAPSRSTLAYANQHRPWELYQTVFGQLLERCRTLAGPRKKFRFKNRLVSLDATVIDLCASLYDWAKFRRTKGAVKLHLVLDHEGYLPSFAVLTEGVQHEIRVARQMRFEPGTIVVMDRGYTAYEWFLELGRQGVYFVTRLNWDEERGETMVFLSNHLEFGATTIAAIYKDRWQIELFFKSLKQLCKVKTFVGTSANALKIQIWTALIAALLLRFLQLLSTHGWSLSNLAALLRQQLFVYRELFTWLNEPFQPPPALAGIHDGQLALELGE